MAAITFKGNPIRTFGNLPNPGGVAPALRLTTAELSDVGLDAYAGKKKILNIVPSLDTGVCQKSARRFNEAVSSRGDTVLLSISADLPFAAKRFCDAEGLKNVVVLSCFRSPGFGKDYGVLMTEGPLAGLLSRAVLVLNADNRIVYAEQVPEIVQEPNYDAALKALASA